MELWMKIGSGILLIAFFFMILPRAKYMLTHSPKGSSNDWMLVAMLFGGIALFIYILIKLV